MSFNSALSIAISGLSATQARAQTAASNIANANTEGYSRRVTNLAENNAGNLSAGVRVVSIDRAEAYFLTKDRMQLETNAAFADEKATTATRLSNLLGEPGADNGLFRDYVRFESSLRDAAATPESSILQAEVIDSARTLTNTFNTMSASAEDQRGIADRAIGAAVNDVNTALKQLEEINSLSRSEVTPLVEDQRQQLVDQINEFIPVTTQESSDGTMKLVTEGGVFLLDVSAKTIDFTITGNVGRSQTLGAPLSGISVNGIDITPGGSASQQIQSGRIAGYFDTRDRAVPEFQDKIDALAADVINRFSDDAVDPTKTAGEAGLFTNGTTTPPGLTNIVGTASSIQINVAVDPEAGGALYRVRDGIGATTEGAAGNGDQLNRLLDAFTSARAAPDVLAANGAQSADGLASQVASSVSFEDRNAAEASIYASTRFDIARETELGTTGVDSDQELQELLLIEQAYAANARVIQTVQQLMAELMDIV